MKAQKLRTRILISFDIVIVAFSVSVALLGYYVIEKNILERAQIKVRNDLNSAREIYAQEVGRVRDVVRLTAQRFFIKEAITDNDRETLNKELGRIRKQESLDVLTLTDSSGNVIIRSRNPSQTGDSQADDKLVGLVMASGQPVAGEGSRFGGPGVSRPRNTIDQPSVAKDTSWRFRNWNEKVHH